jgi:hypothetical protein
MKRDIEPGPLLARLEAGRDEIRIEVRFVAGEPFVDVRRWGREDGKPYPTPRGLLVPADLIPDLVASLVRAFAHRRPYGASAVDSDHSPSPESGPAAVGRRAPRRSLPEPSTDTTPRGLTDREKEN